MPLISQAAYSRFRGVSRQAVSRQVRDGLIPTHGPGKRIDPAEAGQWYVPRIDAGFPQLRLPRDAEPVAEGMDPATELAAWWAWCDTTAVTLSRVFGVPHRRVEEHLAGALRVQLVAVGLLAGDDDDENDDDDEEEEDEDDTDEPGDDDDQGGGGEEPLRMDPPGGAVPASAVVHGRRNK